MKTPKIVESSTVEFEKILVQVEVPLKEKAEEMLTNRQNLNNVVNFHGQKLVKSDYDSLTAIAQKYFKKTAEAYFSNLTNPYNYVYLVIYKQRVVHIKMEYQGLPEIPIAINKLTQLCLELNLASNQISKIENLNRLKKLYTLHLDDNQIHAIKGLDKLTQLQELYLNGNQIHAIKGLNKLTQLQELDLDDNQISEVNGLDKLKKLRILYLNYNHVYEDEPGVTKLRSKGVKVYTFNKLR